MTVNVLYKTPNENFIITRQSDPFWQEIFGVSSTYFNVSKRITGCLSSSEKGLECFEIFHSVANIEEAFKYLRWLKVISNDEMKHQINLLSTEKS